MEQNNELLMESLRIQILNLFDEIDKINLEEQNIIQDINNVQCDWEYVTLTQQHLNIQDERTILQDELFKISKQYGELNYAKRNPSRLSKVATPPSRKQNTLEQRYSSKICPDAYQQMLDARKLS